MKTNQNEVIMTEVSRKLRESRTTVTSVPYELHDLTDYMAMVSNGNIVPEGMLMLLILAMEDIKKGECGFNPKIDFPQVLRERQLQIMCYLPYFPLIIDEIASAEFAEIFRKEFAQVFGKSVPSKQKKEDYGIIIIEEGKVDISNKDKADVLVALYNNSHPQGLGFFQYNAEPMDKESAKEILKEMTSFDYLAGRVMKIDLSTNIVYTAGYNRDNGPGAAEKAIASCPNI